MALQLLTRKRAINEKTKTLIEWQDEFKIKLIDLDGYRQYGTDKQIFERQFTKSEFQEGLAISLYYDSDGNLA